MTVSRDPSPTDDGGDRCRPAASLATAECSVCAGGWPNYFRLIMARQYAGVCETHIAENAAERDRAEMVEGE